MREGCVYFAWVRERVGVAEEEIDPPAGIATVGDLVGWLAQRGESYAYAFENRLGHQRRNRPAPRRADARSPARAKLLSFRR